MATWRELITEEMANNTAAWGDVEACTLTEAELDAEFNAGFGAIFGKPFTLWTAWRVYFPVVYDGSESCGSVPRHPGSQGLKSQPTEHIGGGGGHSNIRIPS
jgi:hypothetical protein